MKHACPMASQQMRPVWGILPCGLDTGNLQKMLHIRRNLSMRRHRDQTMAAGPSGKQQMLVGSSKNAWPVFGLMCGVEHKNTHRHMRYCQMSEP